MEHTDADDYRPDELHGKEAGAKSLRDPEVAKTSGPGNGRGAAKGARGLAIEQRAIATALRRLQNLGVSSRAARAGSGGVSASRTVVG